MFGHELNCKPMPPKQLKLSHLSPVSLCFLHVHSVEESHVPSNLFVPQEIPSNIFKRVLFDALCCVSVSS
jgi:hypothetical protein